MRRQSVDERGKDRQANSEGQMIRFENDRIIHIEDLNFSFPSGDYRWMDVRRFELNERMTQLDALACLISSPWYDHGYDSPTSPIPDPGRRVHGPYRLEAIRSSSFLSVARGRAVTALIEWAHLGGQLPASTSVELDRFIKTALPENFDCWELPDIRATAEHEWGQAVGVDGFIEFVALSPTRETSHLVVATDD